MDFARFSTDGQLVLLVEVKTDDSSRRDKQDNYLARARKKGWCKIVQGILAIATATHDDYVLKYDKLLLSLTKLGFVHYNSPGDDCEVADIKKAFVEASATANCDHMAVEVYYVQPSGSDPHIISFKRFASVLDSVEDPLAPIVSAALTDCRNTYRSRASRDVN